MYILNFKKINLRKSFPGYLMHVWKHHSQAYTPVRFLSSRLHKTYRLLRAKRALTHCKTIWVNGFLALSRDMLWCRSVTSFLSWLQKHLLRKEETVKEFNHSFTLGGLCFERCVLFLWLFNLLYFQIDCNIIILVRCVLINPLSF